MWVKLKAIFREKSRGGNSLRCCTQMYLQSGVSNVHLVVLRIYAHPRSLGNNHECVLLIWYIYIYIWWLCKELNQNWYLHLIRRKPHFLRNKNKTKQNKSPTPFLDMSFSWEIVWLSAVSPDMHADTVLQWKHVWDSMKTADGAAWRQPYLCRGDC